MDVLELPRPVINFLRTMAKEGCRYVLSWDIFGGTDTVTLTLTWKLNGHNEPRLSLSKTLQQQKPHQDVKDDLCIYSNDAAASPRRSRHDEPISILTRIRPSRGKSLEGQNVISTKSSSPNHKQIPSLERSSCKHRQSKEPNPINTNVSCVKYASSPKSISRFDRSDSSSFAHTYHHRTKKQHGNPTYQRAIPSTSIINSTSPDSSRPYHATIQTEDDDDDVLDPWIKDFENSLENHANNITTRSSDGLHRLGNTSGRVKFKRQPDYF